MTRLPARVDPVKETMSVFGCATIASPTTGPVPETMLNTPREAPPREQCREEKRVHWCYLARLQHDVHPAASEAATLLAIWCSG